MVILLTSALEMSSIIVDGCSSANKGSQQHTVSLESLLTVSTVIGKMLRARSKAWTRSKSLAEFSSGSGNSSSEESQTTPARKKAKHPIVSSSAKGPGRPTTLESLPDGSPVLF